MFQFTIRDVLWLIVVVAVGLAGVVAYQSILSENRRLQTMIDSQEATIMDLNQSVQLLLNDPGRN